MVEVNRRAPRRGTHERISVTLQYRPPKGSQAKSRATGFTVYGTRNPDRLLDILTALIRREAGKSIDQLHAELCGNQR